LGKGSDPFVSVFLGISVIGLAGPIGAGVALAANVVDAYVQTVTYDNTDQVTHVSVHESGWSAELEYVKDAVGR
jgi:hypothetical protein